MPQILEKIEEHLRTLEYRSDCWGPMTIPGGTVIPLVACSGLPKDARTACIAIVEKRGTTPGDISAILPCGAPVVISVDEDGGIEVWRQSPAHPVKTRSVPPSEVHQFFASNKGNLGPKSVYRAKVWGHIDHPSDEQLEFVDLNLNHVVEAAAGNALTDLITRLVLGMRERLGWTVPNAERGEWLLKAPFWLIAAKILQDKGVPRFIRLDLEDLDTVFDRLAKHYDSADPSPIQSVKKRRVALLEAARTVKQFGNLATVSTEALGHIFENALVSKETRKSLGTHRTPSWLVDYMVGRLRPWISEQSANDRRIFEPACGHAGFLLAGLRLLEELRPPNHTVPREKYLRERLRGVEIDPFAYEISRLTLTLGDVPNPNGWGIKRGDMFQGDRLEAGIRNATIVISNPPYERFAGGSPAGRLTMQGEELFRQVVENLPEGGCFGLVLSQTALWSQQLSETRARLIRDFEVEEITLFADRVFTFAKQETVMILGRRKAPKLDQVVRYQRVSTSQVATFSESFQPSSTDDKPQAKFGESDDSDLFSPELEELWQSLDANSKLKEICLVGQGFSHKSEGDKTFPKGSVRWSETKQEGLVPAFLNWAENQLTHELPKEFWANVSKEVIRRPRHGTKINHPQLLLNYGRSGLGSWCVKTLLDPEGHAVTSRYVVLRPTDSGSDVQKGLWGLMNSPIVNAFLASISSKRDILVGDIRNIPVPRNPNWPAIAAAVDDYFKAAKEFEINLARRREVDKNPLFAATEGEPVQSDDEIAKHQENLKWLHWRIDAAVLQSYDLSEEMEGKLLRFFTSTEMREARRKGVSFFQDFYFPPDFSDLDCIDDLLAITADWDATSARKTDLIRLKISGGATEAELFELDRLKRLTEARGEYFDPLPLPDLERVRADIVADRAWGTIPSDL